MHACMYACMHVCTCACMHICMHVCMYACMYACMHYMHVCMYACMHACMHVCMYVCMHVRVYLYTYQYTSIYIYVYMIYVCIHIWGSCTLLRSVVAPFRKRACGSSSVACLYGLPEDCWLAPCLLTSCDLNPTYNLLKADKPCLNIACGHSYLRFQFLGQAAT